MNKRLIEMASVVFKEVDGEKYEVLKSRDSQLKLGGKYSEDFVEFYCQTNADVVVLSLGDISFDSEETIEHKGVKYELVSRKAQPGDVVVPTQNTSCCFTNGKVYGPVGEDLEIGDDDGEFLYVYESDFNRTEENVKVYAPVAEAKQEPAPLQAEDYAKIVDATDYHSFANGDIVKVISENCSPRNLETKRLVDGKTQYVPKKQIIKATDEEVAQAKAELKVRAEAERWAKIGRKPNEFKKGDIVRAKIMMIDRKELSGTIGNVEDVTDSAVGIRFTDTYCGAYTAGGNVELITPVEARFDYVGQ